MTTRIDVQTVNRSRRAIMEMIKRDKKRAALSGVAAFILLSYLVGIVTYALDHIGSQMSLSPLMILWAWFYHLGTVIFFGICACLVAFALYVYAKKPALVIAVPDRIDYGEERWATRKEMEMICDFVPINAMSNHAREAIGLDPVTEEAILLKPPILSNDLSFAFAQPGLGKSFELLPRIVQLIDAGFSVVVNDPSGEFAEWLYEYAKRKGAIVRFLAWTDPASFKYSDGFNPMMQLDPRDPDTCITAAQNLAGSIVFCNDNCDESTDFYKNSSVQLLTALILYCVQEAALYDDVWQKEEVCSFKHVYEILGKPVDDIVEVLDCVDEGSVAYGAAQKFVTDKDVYRDQAVKNLRASLRIFESPSVANAMVHNDIDPELPGKRQCVYFCGTETGNGFTSMITGMFYNTLFQTLQRTGREREAAGGGVKNAVPIYFLLDEFPSIGRIPYFSETEANIRKYDIHTAIYAQDFELMKGKYGEDGALSILASCGVRQCMGLTDKRTIQICKDNMGLGSSTFWKEGKVGGDVFGRDLQTLGEIQSMDPRKKVVRIGQTHPYQMLKFPFNKHPEYEWCKKHKYDVNHHVPAYKEREKQEEKFSDRI